VTSVTVCNLESIYRSKKKLKKQKEKEKLKKTKRKENRKK